MANILNPETIKKVRSSLRLGKYVEEMQEHFFVSSRLETSRQEQWQKVLQQPSLKYCLDNKLTGVFIDERKWEPRKFYCFNGEIFELYWWICEETSFAYSVALLEVDPQTLEVLNFPSETTPWQWETENC